MATAATALSKDDVLNLVDLDRYPIDRMDTPEGAAFVKACHQHMAQHGWCSLDNFIRPAAVQTLIDEVNDLLPGAERLTIKRNIYSSQADADAPEGDLKRLEYTHRSLQLADDQIGEATLIKRLYHSDVLTDFIRRVEGKAELHRSADEFQALNIVALPPGSWHGWHYDFDECVVTLLLQPAESGGDFTFLPNCRSRDYQDSPIVKEFLAGDMSHAQTFARGAGTLTIFRGEFSLHGVTEVGGAHPRVTAIFTYDEMPGRVASDEVNIRIYGARAKRIIEARKSA